MLRSLRLGRAFGIPLYVHPTFVLLPAWAAFVQYREGPLGILFGLAILFTLFGCVLLHELGHALMARWFGITTRDITLYPIGGVARLESTGEKPDQEVAIALAGPAVNLAIFLLLTPVFIWAVVAGHLALAPGERLFGPGLGLAALLARFFTALWVGNLVLVVFNLIPAFPMDGGRVLRAVLSLPLGRLRATEVSAALGLGVAVLFGVAAVWWLHNPVLVVVALFVGFAGQMEVAALRHFEARKAAQARPAQDVVVVRPRGPVLVDDFEEVVEARRGGFTGFAWDADRCVWVRWVDGRPVEVYR
jgi:Zn-dependent protease